MLANIFLSKKWILHIFKFKVRQDTSHQWSTRPVHSTGRQWLSLDFEVLGLTDGRILCVKIVITTGRDCGRPRGSMLYLIPYYFIECKFSGCPVFIAQRCLHRGSGFWWEKRPLDRGQQWPCTNCARIAKEKSKSSNIFRFWNDPTAHSIQKRTSTR